MHENFTPFTKNGNGVRNNKPLEAYNNDCIEIEKKNGHAIWLNLSK